MNARPDFTLPDQFGIGQARVAAIQIESMTGLMRDAASRMFSRAREVRAASRETYFTARARREFARAVLAIHGEPK